MDIHYYHRIDGTCPFEIWFESLDSVAAAKVAVAIERMATGNLSDVKSVGAGVCERRVNFGPGYRVYFGRDGAKLILLLTGGTKQRQQQDIAMARLLWADYKRRRRES